MVKLKYRGHNIEIIDNEKWVYSDTKQYIAENIYIKCGYCGKDNTKEGHDKCLGTINGVMNACCGHGVESDAYIQFLNKNCIRGKKAIKYMHSIQNKKGQIILKYMRLGNTIPILLLR